MNYFLLTQYLSNLSNSGWYLVFCKTLLAFALDWAIEAYKKFKLWTLALKLS
ncbi:hypothetical protein [Mycoplasma sp. NEAQ87857]|uniref:hypothetical protein n=1 Tax=Mycoplasma sp. NEAQ87857 TaxID=2683967 RepID=UPI00131E0644|nr:hypothetical protein [Mycoplasma sp. NEAQ87857]